MKDGRFLIFRALIDQGSESSFISKDAVSLLRLKREPHNVTVVGIGGNKAEQIHSSVSLDIRGLKPNSPIFHLKALVMSTLTSHIPHIPDYVVQLPHLLNLHLADDDLTGTKTIDILLGAEVFSSILKTGVRIGRENEPIAQETTLGWIVSGRVLNDRASLSTHALYVTQLDKTLRSFWEIEEVNSTRTLSPEDQITEDYFQRTITRCSNGRYIVKIPFKTDPPDIGETRTIALQCYKKLEARLARNPDTAKLYHEFLAEYRDMGHMTLNDQFKDESTLHFLPHHPVFRESSTTTKLRVVFNASARSSNGNSINDCMYTGPKLQVELFDIVLRWRLFKYVCTADIEKMFRQIRVAPDNNALCVFWKPPESTNVEIFRLNTVTYGTAAAPYLSIRVLHQLADDEKERFPIASKILHRDTYVDDILFGNDSLEHCRTIRDDLISLLRAGGFHLRKWESNCDKLLSDLPEDLRARTTNKIFDSNSSTKVLGIHWQPGNDIFSFQVNTNDINNITKRTILSCIASIFDPLGWVAPTIVIAKIFMQKLWRSQTDWDSELSESLKQEWLTFQNDLGNLAKISVPRWIGTLVGERKWELHGFADASTQAYAAVVYLKSMDNDTAEIALLTSKTRVAPVKEITVPRLELCAAVLLSELMARVVNILELSDIPRFCWSDSSIVLAWLRSCPSRWKRFVANRVSQIHENLPGIEWGYVASEQNPADPASRGVSATDLKSMKLWWHGPHWLSSPQSNWPISKEKTVNESLLELKTSSLVVGVNKQKNEMEYILSKVSSWKRLLSITAIAKLQIAFLRKINPMPSKCEKIKDAETYWLRTLQTALFPEEKKRLKSGLFVNKGKLKSLDPFLDENGIMRVGGRLKNSELSFSIRCPIILSSHPLTRLIISDMHKTTLHGGLQLMRRMLCERYWILRSRDLIRHCIRNCVICVRHRAATICQKMSSLPSERVRPTRPFSNVGVDYAGPFQVRALPGRGRASRKGYVSIFVCLTTRAIHLEFVSDYTSEAFLAAFRRFASRYGLPALVMSDNGTTFQGAERELREAFQLIQSEKKLCSWFANEGMEWKFNPPHAPHFGGIWEAGVKSVKHHLRRVVNNQILTFEEMTTLLAQISACLNSRPIAPLSEDVQDFSYLTPGHFLCGGVPLSVPEIDLSNCVENRLSRWQRVQQMRDQFWRVWRSDYLLQLQQRRKWQTSSANLIIGDIVLLRNDMLPPCKWELGRVVECFKAKDGLVRVVKVQTAKSSFVRAVAKLCLLPLRSTKSTEEFE